MDQLLEGLSRIVRDDQIALGTVLVLAIVQLCVVWRVRSLTFAPLKAETDRILKFAGIVRSGRIPESPIPGGDGHLARAWRSANSGSGGPNADSATPEEAFEPSGLLPNSYNARLDSAAPGLFTALGIIGTFVGLILGFLRVNPAEATTSVGPLLGGMVVAFVNSLLGVSLSVTWTYSSRKWRHAFDVACDTLVDAAQRRVHPFGLGEQMLSALAAIDGNLKQLQSSNEAASRQLLDNLSTKVGDSFRSLVNMPFEQLNATVARFDELVAKTATRHEHISERMESAATQLSQAQAGLQTAITAAKECVEEFALSSLQLREATGAVDRVLDKTAVAAEGLGKVVADVQAAAQRYDEVSQSLSNATVAITAAVSDMTIVTERFQSSTTTLEQAIGRIVQASDDTIEKSVAAVRRELEGSVRILASSVESAGKETVQAYEASSQRVIASVDRGVTDLTDRLSAELTTLSSRLPSEVESLNQAMLQIRQQIRQATRSIEDGVKQLAQRTPEAMNAQLTAYDHALAKAMDHFNGTLEQWDGKIDAIAGIAGELRRIVPAPLDGRRSYSPDGATA